MLRRSEEKVIVQSQSEYYYSEGCVFSMGGVGMYVLAQIETETYMLLSVVDFNRWNGEKIVGGHGQPHGITLGQLNATLKPSEKVTYIGDLYKIKTRVPEEYKDLVPEVVKGNASNTKSSFYKL